MLKKLVNCLILGSLFTSSAFAGDFLAKVSNGAVSDNSVGVKILSLDEMKEVRGGAFQSVGNCLSGTNSCLSLAVSQTITGTHYRDFKAILTNEEPHSTNYHIGFVAQKNWSISSLGKPYSFLTYSAIVFDRASGTMYKQSSQVLNNNGIVRELSYRYKNQFDRQLGGLSR
ncbi:hypothetical protein LMH19_001761 [Campylobacter coli]|nr:hypothetical protein [Campylobacter coli]EJD3102331.1 hypothetical protein [Campylobacter jejuni]ELY8648505.1 hypothetical protein [Campylobacter coli]